MHIESKELTEAAPKQSSDIGKRSPPLKTRFPAGRRFFSKLPFAIAIVTLIAIGHLSPFARQIEDRYGLGLLFQMRGPIPPPDGAIVVSIDKQSIDWLRRIPSERADSALQLLSCLPASAIAELERLKGPSSLPRPIYTCLLRKLSRVGFPVVVFDILFSAPGPPEADKMLAREMRRHGATAILSGYERFAIEKGGAKLVVEQNKQPLPLFMENAAATASFLVPRSVGFVQGYQRQIDGFKGSHTLSDVALDLLKPGRPGPSSSGQPKTEFTNFWLYGPPGAIRTVPIRDILSGDTPDDVLETAANTVAFIGASDPSVADFEDSFPSLFRNESDANIGGVELIATAFLNSRAGHNLRKFSWPLEIAILFAFSLALSFFALNTGTRNMLAIAGLAMGYLVTAFVVFGMYRVHVPIITPIFFAVPAFVVLALVVRSRTAMALIKRLAPAPIARQMLTESSGDRGTVGTSDATVAFFDIIDSTKIGEKLPNVPFGELMNDFHDIVTREVEKCGGCVIAFAGDGATALFNDSIAGSDHALLACRSAAASILNIRNLNLENENRGIPPLGVRVGMNSGLVAAGPIGAEDRFNFAVVGDAVNIAAKLEQLGKTLFPGDPEVILVALATQQRVQGEGLSFVDCGLQQIPGRTRPENVFRLQVG